MTGKNGVLAGKKIGFLGAGSMAGALIEGLLAAGMVQAQQILVTNRVNRQRLDELKNKLGVKTTESLMDIVSGADVLVIAVKPKDVKEVLEEVRPVVSVEQVVVSVAAGIRTDFIRQVLRKDLRVIRAMPNTSVQVRAAATGVAVIGSEPEQLYELARAIFQPLGTVVFVREEQLDAVTAVSGSGPAYFYYMVEALVTAGVQVGLELQTAQELVVQTIWGAAKMLKESGLPPGTLREKVTSPGGTTEAALKVFAQDGFPETIAKAVKAATRRGEELGLLYRVP